MRGAELQNQLYQLVANWEHQAVPTNGRYSQFSSVIDVDGNVSAPPPVRDYRMAVVAALGAVAACQLVFGARERKTHVPRSDR
jgi:hypothetical protein